MRRAHIWLSPCEIHQFRKWAKRWLHLHAKQCALAKLACVHIYADGDGCLVVGAVKDGRYWDMLTWPDPPQPWSTVTFRAYRVTCLQCANHAITEVRQPRMFRSLYELWQSHCGRGEAEEVLAKLSAGAKVEFLGGSAGGYTAALLHWPT